MKREIAFTIRTFKPTADWELGRAVLEFITTFDKRLTPQVINRSYSSKYTDFVSVAACEKYWASVTVTRGSDKKNSDFYYYREGHTNFIFKRRHVVKSSFEFRHTLRTQRGNLNAGTLTFSAQYHKAIDWNALFLGLCNILQSHDAMMHYFGEDEAHWRLWRSVEYPELAHHTIFPVRPDQKQLRDACYYIEENEVQRLSDAGYSIERMQGGYLVKVTDKVEDMISDYDAFADRRRDIKALFPKKTLRGHMEHLVFAEK